VEFYKNNPWNLPGIEGGIVTIDSHTAGELTRLVVGGVGDIPGENMALKRAYFQQHYDHVRQMLTWEPRSGGIGMATVVTEPISADARFGLIYMDARRYPYLCGHATIGAVVTLARTGFLDLQEGENRVVVDTPSGLMFTTAFVREGKVQSVSLSMLPSFVLRTNQVINVPDFGKVTVDLVCVGGFFAMVSAEQLGIEPTLANKETLVDLGMKIIAAANQQVEVFHPERPEVKTVDVVEFYGARPGSQDTGGVPTGRAFVVYGESHVDRSPCGTGTAAKLTLLYHANKIDSGQTYTNYSPLGTSFDAKVTQEVKVGELDAVIVQITGMAHITGVYKFFIEEGDPFPQGFIL
jgi:proline racemase